MSPARHLAYAVQWFAFGVVAVVVLVVTSLRRGRGQDGERQ
jgi:cytochrome oxidase assembly protein ShyY1